MSTEAQDRARIKSARARKAGRLAEGCVRYGVTADQAEVLDQAGRDALAALMHCHTPSEATWTEVVERVRAREAS